MAHTWQFFRAGGVDQVAFRSGADFAHLGELDQKLWVALACPTRGVEFDARTLDLIDTDKDGRIRPPELIAACEWACQQLRSADDLLQPSAEIRVADISDGEVAGVDLGLEARRILELLGKTADDPLTLDDVSDRTRLIAAMRFNGDGVITAATPEDDALQQVVEHIIACMGPVNDLNGDDGIDSAKSDAFFTHANALRDWHAKIAGDVALQPFGTATDAAAKALDAVQAKIDDFFARCQLAAYDASATVEMNPSSDRYKEVAAQSLTLASTAIADLPLASVIPGRQLPLTGDEINPAWQKAMAALQESVIVPYFTPGPGAETAETAAGGDAGAPVPEALTQAQWNAIVARLAPYRQWTSTRPATPLDDLSIDTIDAIANSNAQDQINGLIDEDKAIEPHNARIVDLERLLRYKRDLLRLVDNFVNFKEFYRRDGAIFEAGTLYLDGRSCVLSVLVGDVSKHAPLAGLAKACLAYIECHRPDGQKMIVVSAFTAGDTDFLFVGRNGIFYDRSGNDWDATIIRMIDNPTNVRQAFLSPYKKFIRAIEEQVAKRAAANDAAVQSNLGSIATGLAAAGAPGNATTAAGAKATSKIDVGTVAALGVALGSISAVLVGVFGKFVELGWWIPVALIGIMLAISGPSMLVAWLKLRQRCLGPILDASGWAINAQMKVNVRLGGLLSQIAHVPLGAHSSKDPYADRRSGWGWVFLALVVVLVIAGFAWRLSWADGLLPAGARYPAVAARVAAVLQVPKK